MDYQIFFIFLFTITLLGMKLSSLVLNGVLKEDFKFLFNSPLINSKTRSLSEKRTLIIRNIILRKFLKHSLIVLVFYSFYEWLFNKYSFSIIEKAYLFSIYIYLFTNFMAATGRALSLLTTEIPVDMHNRPYLSKSISEFWGQRWNKWVQDWLNLLSKKCAPRSIKMRIFWAFFFSGLFHEVMFNLPYTLFYGENAMGLMMIYFVFQFFFMIFDRKFLRVYLPQLRRAFMWFSILAPIPFFINKPLLSFFGFL